MPLSVAPASRVLPSIGVLPDSHAMALVALVAATDVLVVWHEAMARNPKNPTRTGTESRFAREH